MSASLKLPPRDKCPGCHSAIYDGAREQGWCTDCMPPEIEALRREIRDRKGSPTTRLHNICAELEKQKHDSPYSAESWDQLIAENDDLRKQLVPAVAEPGMREAVLEEALNGLRMTHTTCEDCWYSCPKSGECCNDSLKDDECNCGADKHNKKLDALIALKSAGASTTRT